MLGDYFFVGLERVGSTTIPGAVAVYSTTGLAATRELQQKGALLYMPTGVTGAGQLAVAKLAPMPGETSSRYLLIVGGAVDTENLFFYLSPPGVSLENGASSFIYQGKLSLKSGSTWLNGWSDYQNFNLVTDCATGELFIITLSRDGASGCNLTFGDDYVKIFKLTSFWNPIVVGLTGFGIGSGPLSIRHMYSHGNFDAAAGVFVDGVNKLVIYATEHDNDGDNGTIKASEYGTP